MSALNVYINTQSRLLKSVNQLIESVKREISFETHGC